jgi:hypothetical protein
MEKRVFIDKPPYLMGPNTIDLAIFLFKCSFGSTAVRVGACIE